MQPGTIHGNIHADLAGDFAMLSFDSNITVGAFTIWQWDWPIFKKTWMAQFLTPGGSQTPHLKARQVELKAEGLLLRVQKLQDLPLKVQNCSTECD